MDTDRCRMKERDGEARLHQALCVAVGLVFLTFPASPSSAFEQDRTGVDSRWASWLGCWELVLESVDHLEETPEETVWVCLTPREGQRGVRIQTLAADQVVLEETFVADGEHHAAEEPGCRGWQSAEWSRDGRRLFMFSETTCDRGDRRRISGMSWIAANGTWLDIQAIETGERKELVVRQYRRARPERMEEAGVGELYADPMIEPVAETRGSPLDIDDVIEAAQKVDPTVIEAALLEGENRFDLNAESLIRLGDARVPKDVIDLMVAMSFPEHFQVGRARGGGGGGVGGPGPGWTWEAFDPYSYYYPFYYAPFGFYSYWYAPYRGYYLLTPSETEPDSGGRAVKGRGYTRVQPTDSRSAGGRGGGAWGRGETYRDGSTGSVGEGGYRGGSGTSTGRTAKPKNQNND